MKLKAMTTVALFSLLACGSPSINAPRYQPVDGSESSEDSGNLEGALESVDESLHVDPPRQYYHGRLAETYRQMDSAGLGLAAPTAPSVFLNFDGGTVAKSFDSTGSFLICGMTARIPPSNLSPADRDEVAKSVEEQLISQLGAIAVFSKKPLSGSFETVLIGGSYADLGCGQNPNVTSAGPADLFSINPNDFVFAFLDHEPSNDQLVKSIVHQTIASLGQGLPKAPNASPNGPATFQPVPGLPNLDARSRHLPGINQIAAFGQLLPDLAAAPDASQLVAQLSGIVPAGTELPGLDRIVSIVAVANGAAATGQSGGNGGAGNLSAILSPNNLAGGLGGLAAVAGLGDITQAIGAIGAIFGGLNNGGASGGNQTSNLPPMTTIPDFSSILQIPASATPGNLLADLASSGAVINANYAGADRDALLSMVKAAYAQALVPHLPAN